MLSSPLLWGALIVGASILWAGNYIVKVIHAANLDRREDHRELMATLEGIARDASNLDMAVGGISAVVDPLPDDPMAVFEPLMEKSNTPQPPKI